MATRNYRTNPLPFQVALANLERQMAEHLKRQGERLRQARKALNLSQEGAAQLVGVSSKTFGDWERGKAEPRDSNWRKIEERLAVASEEMRGEPPQSQLDRIEQKLDWVLDALGITPAGAAEALEQAARASARKSAASAGTPGAKKSRRATG